MRKITIRVHNDAGDPDAYWRRRFFILGGGLAVLMLLAWLFGGGEPSRQASQTAAIRASAAARQARGSLPGAAYGTPTDGAGPSVSAASASAVDGGRAGTSSSPSSAASASPSASASASGSARASGSASPSAPAKGSGTSQPCRKGGVVLSLFTSKPGYHPRESPRFRVYAVATSAAACRMEYGPGTVRVVVTRHGRVVWDSAACEATRKGSRTVRLVPGVPRETDLSWNRQASANRKASARSCAGTLPDGQAGTFQAIARADGHFSPARSFKLLR